MLRGAIDLNDGWRIGGWIYSPEVPVHGRLLLAFVDGQCVGSGHVTVFRQDLADAGLGDGQCGFDFPITLARVDDRARVYVKLDWSDFALTQQNARIVDGDRSAAVMRAYAPESLAWLHARGWIGDGERAALHDLSSAGFHILPADDAPAAVAGRFFALYHQAPVRVQETLIRLHNLGDERERLIEGAAIPILGVHAPAGEIVVGSARHGCGEDRLLLVDARLSIAGAADTTARVYRAI